MSLLNHCCTFDTNLIGYVNYTSVKKKNSGSREPGVYPAGRTLYARVYLHCLRGTAWLYHRDPQKRQTPSMQWPLLIACFSSKSWLVASASQELRPPACTLAAMLGHVGVRTSESEPTRGMPQFLASLQIHCETSGKVLNLSN